jgi:16S rRNA (cytosine1402-N4)-methyltransferase
MPTHIPVMPEAVSRHLAVKPNGVYVDVTTGLGGHSRIIASQLSAGGRLISRDRDAESLDIARGHLKDLSDRITFEQGEFSTLRESLDRLGIAAVDGILADCGVSFYQLTDAERGFSIMRPGPLDMRQDRSRELTAATIVNFYSEREIADLILRYGEERRARRAAGAIVRGRPIYTTDRLAAIVAAALPRTSNIHPATRVFQALRIAVNRELEELQALMQVFPRCLRPGGRMVAISFHSLEDRIVKQAFQQLARTGRATILTKHVERPGEEESSNNPAARSAKLRALSMI